MITYTRAREARRRFQRARPAERPARVAWAALRLLADVAISFFAESVRGDDGARAVGATDDVMLRPPRRRRRWTAISYGVIEQRSKNLQHS
jgi:hypothetical protein